MNILQYSTKYAREVDEAGARIIFALNVCQHENQLDEPDYELEETLTTCLDCGAVYNAMEDLWYE